MTIRDKQINPCETQRGPERIRNVYPKQTMVAGMFLFVIGVVALSLIPAVGNSTQPASVVAESVKSDVETGRVLPFSIIGAIRSFGFQDGLVAAQISVSVDGGVPADWMATAIYLAEHSIVNGVTFSQVEVYTPSPWGDMPPTHSKILAKVYYAPEPSRSPWSEKWAIFAAEHAATIADVEYEKLTGDLMAKYVDRILDPEKLGNRAEAEARKMVIIKYGLPAQWRPTNNLGLTGTEHGRAHIRIIDDDRAEASMSALARCLNDNQGSTVKGCRANRTAN